MFQLITLLALYGCGPAAEPVVTTPAPPAVEEEVPTVPVKPEIRQYDEGTLGIQRPGGGHLGTISSWRSTTSKTNGSNIEGFHSVDRINWKKVSYRVVELIEPTDQQKPKPEDDFNKKYKKDADGNIINCTTERQECLAKGAWKAHNSFKPGDFYENANGGADSVSIFRVSTTKYIHNKDNPHLENPVCGKDNQDGKKEDSGWIYRVRYIDEYGQITWKDRLFAKNATWKTPDLCTGKDDNDTKDASSINTYKHVPVTNPPGPKAFVTLLKKKEADCAESELAWCGACPEEDSCTFIEQDELKWYQQE